MRLIQLVHQNIKEISKLNPVLNRKFINNYYHLNFSWIRSFFFVLLSNSIHLIISLEISARISYC